MKIKEIISSSSGAMSWYRSGALLHTPYGLCHIDNSKGGLFLLFHHQGRQYRRFYHGDNPSQRYAVTC